MSYRFPKCRVGDRDRERGRRPERSALHLGDARRRGSVAPARVVRRAVSDRGKIALGVLAIFTTLVVLAGLLSRGIARPIRALAAASQDVARGGPRMPEAPATAAIKIRELYANSR
ncbi:hypothetical protein OKW76_13585 [Sphingomonas sp. S1-29]|uniref:hypothetical protein n=1 Tax=Sphingomonas sp. S1-29 TaxID=2991074 RepID=UPI00223F76CE|nr:hypothetical protein [Sphingomonas sp. S1-29]UZK69046.1 hypothetical protein OKW76_13585 [Sphingomonas sp. S1-29]